MRDIIALISQSNFTQTTATTSNGQPSQIQNTIRESRYAVRSLQRLCRDVMLSFVSNYCLVVTWKNSVSFRVETTDNCQDTRPVCVTTKQQCSLSLRQSKRCRHYEPRVSKRITSPSQPDHITFRYSRTNWAPPPRIIGLPLSFACMYV